jgi:hypothetical protein
MVAARIGSLLSFCASLLMLTSLLRNSLISSLMSGGGVGRRLRRSSTCVTDRGFMPTPCCPL